MRLEPIERPRSLVARIGYWMARRQLGKVPAAFKVVYARAPKLAAPSYRISRLLDRGLSLDGALVKLVMTHASMLNGCSFCADLHRAEAVRAELGLERFRALADWRGSPLFGAPERAALAFAEEVTRQRRAADETFAELARHFDERQIVELTWVVAIGNFFNLLALPLGLADDGLTELALRRRRGSPAGAAPR